MGILASVWIVRRAPPARIEAGRRSLTRRLFEDDLSADPLAPAPGPIVPPPPAA
jgi:hypothetical protein